MGWSVPERWWLAVLGILALAALSLQAAQRGHAPLAVREAPPATTAAWDQVLARARQVDVNTADVAELERLPGVGPALARRIVADRAQHGPFASVTDVTRVAGIGPKTLAALADHLTVTSTYAARDRE